MAKYNDFFDDDWEQVTDQWGTFWKKKEASDDDTASTSGSKKKKKKKHYSDYWAGRYFSSSYSQSSKSDTLDKDWKLKKCLHDVSKIASIFDKNASLGYLSSQKSKNNVKASEILLDPRIALSDDKDFGEKIDFYAGDVLVNSAYRSIFDKNDLPTYYGQYANLTRDQDDPDFSIKDNIIANLFMAIESNRAHQLIDDTTPGFKNYCKERAEEKGSDSNTAITDLLSSEDPQQKRYGQICSIIKEVDTYNLNPLKDVYDDSMNQSIKESLECARLCSSTQDSLALAESIFEKYPVNENEKQNTKQFVDAMNGALASKELHGVLSEQQKSELGEFLEDLESNMESDGVNYKDKYAPDKLVKWEEGDVFDGSVVDLKPTIYPFDEYYSKNLHVVDRESYLNQYGDSDFGIKRSDKPAIQSLYTSIVNTNYQLIDAIQDSLTFSNSETMSWEEYGMRNGLLDEGGLDKIAQRSDRLFFNPIIESIPKIIIAVVIDQSYSMGEEGMRNAKAITISLAEAIKNVKGVDFAAYIQSGGSKCNLGRYVIPGCDSDEYHKLAYMPTACHTYDGYAIKAVGEEISNIDGYTRKIIFMISDGEPSGEGYSGVEAFKHCRSVSNYLREDLGVEVYGLGVNGAYRMQGKWAELTVAGIHGDNKGELLYGKGNAIAFDGFDINEISTKISAFLGNICGDS